MSPRALAEVLFTILGLYVLCISVPLLGYVIFPVPVEGEVSAPDFTSGSLATFALGFVLASSLIAWRRPLAAMLFASEQAVGPTHTSSLQQVAVSILGVYFFIDGISDFLSHLIWSWSNTSGALRAALPSMIRATLGLALFFGARGVQALWETTRNAGKGSRAA